jgi:formylglycine-generating enzyme required for sulfatase activity
VRDEVLASTGGKQEPYVTGSLGGEVVSIIPGVPGVGQAPAQRPAVSWSHGSTPLAEEEERALKPKDMFKECTACPEMVVVPAGEYLMGTSSDEIISLTVQFFPGAAPRSADAIFSSEQPQRRVKIAKPFAVGKFEITFAEWEACSAGGGCSSNKSPTDTGMGKGRRPVINVSWDDARDYVEWLSRHTGKTYRLLTEAEWEYAARAGTTTNYAFGDKITGEQARLSEVAPYSAGTTAEVGSFPANRFRLHDMHGNVGEWVEDCWNADYRGAPADGSAGAVASLVEISDGALRQFSP